MYIYILKSVNYTVSIIDVLKKKCLIYLLINLKQIWAYTV